MPARPSDIPAYGQRLEAHLFSRAECGSTIDQLFTAATGQTVTALRGHCAQIRADYEGLLAAAWIVTCTDQVREVAVTQLIGTILHMRILCRPEEQEAWQTQRMAELDEIFGRDRVMAAVRRDYDGIVALEVLVHPSDVNLHARRDWGSPHRHSRTSPRLDKRAEDTEAPRRTVPSAVRKRRAGRRCGSG
jgi:hypothetical protein